MLGDLLHEPVPLEGAGVKELQRRGSLRERRPGEFPLVQQVQLISPDFLRSQLVRRLAKVTGEIGHGVCVNEDRVRGVVPKPEILGHSSEQFGHEQPPFGRSMVSNYAECRGCSTASAVLPRSGLVQVAFWEMKLKPELAGREGCPGLTAAVRASRWSAPSCSDRSGFKPFFERKTKTLKLEATAASRWSAP